MLSTEYIKIAVIEVQIENIKGNILIPAGYEKALLVFRYRNSLVGKKIFNVFNGYISIKKIMDFLPEISILIWQTYLDSYKEAICKKPLVTIIICTYNRSDQLENCLASLQKVQYTDKEIIVVDNSPHIADTQQVVSKFSGIQYFPESRKGLDIARNTGLNISNGEIVCFIDDDAIADPLWIDNLVKNFSHPLTAIVTGLTLPYRLETFAQTYFEETNGFDRGFQRKEFDFTNINPIASGKVGAGVNMAIRKSLINEIGLFDEALDGGTLSRSGGDQEFFYRALIKGFRIVYEPSALVWHNHREDFASLSSTLFGYGTGVFAWWTRALFLEKEFKLLIVGPMWFLKYHVINLIKAILIKRKMILIRLSFAELAGALTGPFSYIAARKKVKNSISPNLKVQELIHHLKA